MTGGASPLPEAVVTSRSRWRAAKAKRHFSLTLAALLAILEGSKLWRSPTSHVSFYHLRVEYSTTSDWSTLTLEPSQAILTARLVSTIGSPSGLGANPTRLWVRQPIDEAHKQATVGLVVDYALDSAAGTERLHFVLEKGALNTGAVRITALWNGKIVPLTEISHVGVVDSDPARNPRVFSVDLTLLRTRPAEQGTVRGFEPRGLVWAFYYSWYRSTSWADPHIGDAPLAPYSSDDGNAVTQQVEQARTAGVDGFICSWWGPGHYTDQNLRLVLAAAATRGFRVSVYVETLDGAGHPRDPQLMVRWLAYLISTYGKHPAFMRIDGKPVLFLWASANRPLVEWERIVTQLRDSGLDAIYIAMGYDVANLELFSGIHEYAVFSIPDLASTLKTMGRVTHYYPLLAASPEPRIWVATVQPGYDERLLPRRRGLLQDRENGGFYRRSFQAALQSDPDWIVISTWNEWWEQTEIEPSRHYGDEYLRITREFGLNWKHERGRN